jgi:hypothetical protein
VGPEDAQNPLKLVCAFWLARRAQSDGTSSMIERQHRTQNPHFLFEPHGVIYCRDVLAEQARLCWNT